MSLQGIMKFVSGHKALTMLVCAHLPYVYLYFSGMWRQQVHYQFFPFAIGAFCYLAMHRRRDSPENWSRISVVLIGLDLGCIALGLIVSSPWLFAVGLFLVILAWCAASVDEATGRKLTYLALLPLLTIRLPVNGDVQLIQWLQQFTTRVASQLLQRFGYIHVRSGNVLDFPGKQFLVEEACSGVQSLFTVLFIAALVICLKRRTFVHAASLFCSAVLFAGIMNIVRVMAIAVVWEVKGDDLSTGIRHDILGYACLTIAAVLLMSADSFLAFLTDPVPDIRRPGAVAMVRNPFVTVWNLLFKPKVKRSPGSQEIEISGRLQFIHHGLFKLATAVFCGMLIAVQGRMLLVDTPSQVPKFTSSVTIFDQDSLPVEISGFVREGYNTETRETGSDYGEFSNLWTYTGNGGQTRIACDHPFFGWHPLQQCYVNQGWQINEISFQADVTAWSAVVAKLSHPGQQRYGLLLYSLFDASGNPVAPPDISSPGATLMNRLFRNDKIGLLDPVTYQSQVFSESVTEVEEDRLKELLKLHFEAREIMRQSITNPD